MAFENWDDHDRSDRYTAQSLAKAYLNSIDKDKDAMIFTIGDNDTFALWYAQEIENYRTDVRTINTSLIATDWYIDQMKKRTYNSSPIPSQLEHNQYAHGIRDYIKYEALIDSVRWNIKDFMNWVSSDDPRTKYKNLLVQYGADLSNIPLFTQNMVYYPTNKIRVPVNKQNVLNSGLVKPSDADLILDYIDVDLPTSGLYKNQILMLDILANNDWKRPIYFTGGSYNDAEYLWMKDYLQLDGLVYKLVPIRTEIDNTNPYEMGRIDSESMYEIVKSWEWGNSESPLIYHDPETRKNSISFRGNLHRLAKQLILDDQKEKAEEILDLSIEKMPIDYFGYYSLLEPYISTYYSLEKFEKGDNLYKKLSSKYDQTLNYYSQLSKSKDSRFSIYTFAENIITDTERYRVLVETLLKSQDNNLKSNSIVQFINSTEFVTDLYGEYDYYILLFDYVEELFILNNTEFARELYFKISKPLKERILILLAMEEKDEYYQTLLNDYFQLKSLVEIITTYDEKNNYVFDEIKEIERITNDLNEIIN